MNLRRRTVLFGSLAAPFVAAQTLSSRALAAHPAEKVFLVRQSGVIESERFVQSWYSSHEGTIDFDEISVLLYQRLAPLWRSRGVTALAGLTTVGSFFCVLQMAADHGLRVMHREVRDLSAVSVEQALACIGERRPLPLFDVLPRTEPSLTSWLLVPRSWLTRGLS